eukprot:c15251_g1_i1 orf=78-689(-)
MIFRTNWLKDDTPHGAIEKIMKVHNDSNVLAKFEEHRDAVKAKASKFANKKHPRCIADGNELLRFHCTTMSCTQDINGSFSLCALPSCNLCNILRFGFLPNEQKGVHTAASSGKAQDTASALQQHAEKTRNEKRATIICRVIAGRVKRTSQEMDSQIDSVHANDFDSIAGDEDETVAFTFMEDLFVLDPKAILPCFVVIYRGD